MTLAHVAHGALLPAAVFAWRWSRAVSMALGVAFAAAAVYLAAPWEPLRWVSALVGLVGIEEAGRGAAALRRGGEGGRRALLGLLCFCSMAGDGAAHLLHRAGWPWVFDLAQIIVCGAMICVCVWPRRREP